MPNELQHLGQKLAELEKENKRLTKALQQSEELSRKVFHASSNMMAIHRIKDWSFVDVNEAAVSLGGFTREELLKKMMTDDLLENPGLVPMVAQKLKEEGRAHNMELKVRTKEGDTRTVLFSADPVTYNDEPCMLAVSVDITERKNAENALRESEERFRLIAETIDEIFWLFDAEKFITTYLSPAYERIWGYPRQHVIDNQEPFWDPIHPEDRDRVFELGELMRVGQPLDCEYRIIRPDGAIRNLWHRGFPVMDKDGRVKRYVGVGQDVTEWRRAEEALKESREYLNQIINCIGDPIFVKDREHRFVLVNDAMCTFIGLPREQLLGLSEMPEAVAISFWGQEENVFKTGKEHFSEDTLVDAQGVSRTLLTKKFPLTDKSGNKQLVGVLRDITEYKRLESQFLQSQKMEAIGVLAGGVAHDFNNLLNVINGYAELILDDLNTNNPMRKDVEQIRDAGQRAAALTSQLLAFGRKQIMQPEILDLNRVIAGMSSMLRRMIGEDIEVVSNPHTGPALVNADPGKIQQVVMNLVVNARDAMPNGGTLTIETANVDFEESYIRDHPVAKPGPYILLAISDNGIGMDAATQARIFEPFFTTKSKEKGTGLGLSTVYGIVKQSGGFIWVYSEPGNGTTVKVYFPREAGPVATAPHDTESGTEIRGSETVLIVEDEAAVRGLASRILRERGYRVLEAADGIEALRIAQDYPQEIHLVLTDVVMPGVGGRLLVSSLEGIRPAIKSLFISGYTDNAIVHQGILDANVAFLQKPFSVDGLTRKVHEVLHAKQKVTDPQA